MAKNVKKYLKYTLFSIIGLLLTGVVLGGLFAYKAMYGFSSYETVPPELPADLGEQSVLLFSKTNAFRHGEAIEASVPVFRQMGEENGWSVFATDNGAVFNPEQLQMFDVVVWNNVSGKVLNPAQREVFRDWLQQGGGFVGIHAAGDFSHQWDWYEEEVIGARFSHHTMNPQFQEGRLTLVPDENRSGLSTGLPAAWVHEEEWYVFYSDPRGNGFDVLYTLDGSGINPDGSIPFLAPDKDFGMGSDHPVAWYGTAGEGRIFYTSLGHQAAAFQEAPFLMMLENALRWAGRFDETEGE